MNFNDIWQYKNKLPETFIFATLKKDVDAVSRIIPAGTRVRIWMVSRFGDVGITDNLTSAIGYDARVDCENNPTHRNTGQFDDWFENLSGM